MKYDELNYDFNIVNHQLSCLSTSIESHLSLHHITSYFKKVTLDQASVFLFYFFPPLFLTIDSSKYLGHDLMFTAMVVVYFVLPYLDKEEIKELKTELRDKFFNDALLESLVTSF